jgi:hypothetical protein
LGGHSSARFKDLLLARLDGASGHFVFRPDPAQQLSHAGAAEVLELARQKSAAEAAKCAAIDSGVPVADLPT